MKNRIAIYEIGAKRQPVAWINGIDDEDNMEPKRPLHIRQTITDAEGPVNLLGMGKAKLRVLSERGLKEDGRCPPGYVIDKIEIDNQRVGVLNTTLVYADALDQMKMAMKWISDNLVKPSDFRIDNFGMPFIGSLGRIELEVGAAALVRVCAVLHEDTWKPVTTDDVRRTIDIDIEMGFWRQPVAAPDWWGLVDDGYAMPVDGDFPSCGLMLTDLAASKIIDAGWVAT